MPVSSSEGSLQASSFVRALAGLFLSGVVYSFIGAILPAWGHHFKGDFTTVGNYFLSLDFGILFGVSASYRLVKIRTSSRVMALGCALGCAAFLFLSFVPPPFSPWLRMAGLFVAGLSGGIVNMVVFHTVGAIYPRDPAATLNLAGVFFGLGCITTALLVAGTFYIYTVSSILVFFAVIPGFLAVMFARATFPKPRPSVVRPWRQVIRDFQSPTAVLFALLVFFQFGNEYAIAGWLTLFLIQRLGVSPESSLFLLVLYWLTLLVGRGLAQFLLRLVPHGRLLFGGAVFSLLGCTILLATNNMFGATTGILLIGSGFVVIYPLVAEQIGDRFPYYHPGFFNGIFSIAITGGLLAPWSLGLFADRWGIKVVMMLPLAGTCMVFLLLILLFVEARLTGPKSLRKAAD